MIAKIFENILPYLKDTAPISIMLNIILGIILLVIGLTLLTKKTGQNIGKKICLSISALAFIGAISTWLFSYVLFS